MQCPTCEDTLTTAFCRECGKGVCEQCVQSVEGVSYCSDCAATIVPATAEPADEPRPPDASAPPDYAARPASANPYSREVADAPHPVLAGVLGFVPGLGAVYNGQYVKGVLHVLIFGLLMAIATSSDDGFVHALLVPMIALFGLYMPIEAIRTAQALRRGETVEEMSGIIGALFANRSSSPVPGILFIALGVFLLLFTLGILELEMVLDGWPVLLIGLGVWRLYAAVKRDEQQVVDETSEPRKASTLDLG
jgi:TM2 domain-containing membrane protein YozV